MQGKRITQTEMDIVQELYDEGVSVDNIALKMRYHRNSVLKIIKGERVNLSNIKVPHGRQLCSCCKRELVPKKPLHGITKLIRLCARCYTNEENDDDEDFICNPTFSME